jgi:hypothetical protein
VRARFLIDLSRSGWGRGIGIVVRAGHLAAMALLLGAVHFAAPEEALETWRVLTIASGLALLLIEVSHGSRHWVYQGRGVVTLLHVASLALLLVPGGGRAVWVAALGLGAVGSHLPRRMRKWSFRHRRVVD